jgi:hypothetical protein
MSSRAFAGGEVHETQVVERVGRVPGIASPVRGLERLLE